MVMEENREELMESSAKIPVDNELSSPLLQQIDNVIIQNLEYPWKDIEDTKPTDLEYELFCGALESFWSKPLIELIDDWTISMETILPTIRSSIRIYTKAASCEEKVREMDIELARWVEFGLSSNHSISYAGNNQMIMIGCSLTKQLSAMHEKDLSVTFCTSKYLHYIMDIISSKQHYSSTRCEAAQALLGILFHPSISWKFMATEIEGNKYTPYEQIIHLFMKPEQDVPLDLLVVLQKIASYFAFKYNTDVIINCTQRLFVEEDCDVDVDTTQLFSSFKILNNFFSKIRDDFSYMSRTAHRTVVENCLIPHVCAHVASPSQDARIRYLAIRCLQLLCDFDGTDITGAVFLSHMGAQTVSLVGRLLQQLSEDSKEKSLLPYALRAIVLVDKLAASNEKCVPVIDVPERVTILQNMLHMLLVEEGRLAMISALSFGDNPKHLLHMCDLQKSILTPEGHIVDDIKTRFRQTATYGYLCEILFALARNQSDGMFWRMHGPEIIKLIDCNLISAATSLKHWLEPFREELALGRNINTLNFLTMRLTYHSEKYVEGDPPLALVTVLRLIDAVLDEPEDATLFDVSSDEIRFDYYAKFYEDDGLEKIRNVLDVANTEQSKRVHYRCTALTGDSYIYCQFVRSAANIMCKLLSSLQAINQNPDKLIIDTLLRTYTLCCMDEASSDRIVRETIINSIALFIFPILSDRQGLRRAGQRSFLELFLNSGFERPPNFFATLDILLQLFPLPSDLLANVIGINVQEITSVEKLWSDRILEHEKQLQFAIMLGISSSQRLKRRLFDLFKRLAYCSENNALCLIDILIKQSLRMLTSSAHTAVIDAFEDDIVEEESNVRFGNAVDLVTASFYAFLATCSGEFMLRNSMVIIISQRRSYIPTLLKFFKLASPKTSPHVSFQTHVIKIFRNLCIADNNFDGKIDCLPRDVYIKICDNLVEHFGNGQHNIETIMLAMESVCSIGHSSAFGRAVINNAVISNEGALLRLMDRVLMGEPIDKLLFELATQLVDLFENVLKKDSVRFLAMKLQSSTNSEPHSLVRLKNQLTELNCSKDMLLSLQRALDASTQAESVEALPEDLEAYEWPENVTTVQQVDSRQITNYHVKDLLNSDNGNFHDNAALSTVDLNMLNEEFFPETVLISAKKSASPVQPQSINSVPKWKTFNFEGPKRKRPYTTKKILMRPKIRRY
ncbi:hypothetical protein LOAG_17591 [Loa loa]|uniref:Uncharacterized protein n=1 Tax=Loa loa TaxID=7209 RepID=A0A1S0UKA5_LOALO|nr:hypothetical protein LOAG_17591 [Loa loa]EJD75224.1 hypothetical protein LOAG_17591 [Loa loa]